MPPKIPLTQDQLNAHLGEQLDFLRRSCDAYDEGFDAEAKRIASTLRILLHQTKSSHALLDQLDRLNTYFVDTSSVMVPGNVASYSNLTYMKVGENAPTYQPRLGRVSTWVPFKAWWNSPVLRDDGENILTRASLVLTAANQDGGAHVDPSLNPIYARLSTENSLGHFSSDGVTHTPMRGVERASLRQIGHEVLMTLIPGYAKDHVEDPHDPAPIFVGSPMLVAGEFVPPVMKEPAIVYKKSS